MSIILWIILAVYLLINGMMTESAIRDCEPWWTVVAFLLIGTILLILFFAYVIGAAIYYRLTEKNV